jgi:methyl-accepting chemotaxis protein
MNSSVLWALLVFGPFGFLSLYLGMRLLLKKSVVRKIAFVSGASMLAVSLTAALAGIFGPNNYFWQIPLSLILNTLVFRYMELMINTPLIKVAQAVNELEKGNLKAEFDESMVNRDDELGWLNKAGISLKQKLNEIILSVRNSAELSARTSEQLVANSQELSQSASEQASSVEEVSSSIEEMVANIEQNNENAKQSEAIANASVESIAQNTAAIDSAVNSMNEIARKISIINDIAFQTNILALNAAVEAARAGEHGKGFAVVAAEVRKLAERSKIAAEEIDRLSNEGVQNIEKASISFGLLAPQIKKTSIFARDIATASSEQHTGSEQINSTIQQLNMITQRNAASSEELAASAELLSTEAHAMLNTIMYFK